MKIALCFSGLPRFIQQTADNIHTNLIRDYDVDVFVHTWYDHGKLMRDCGDSLWANYTFQEDPTDLIKSLYNIKGIEVEPGEDFFSSSPLRKFNYQPALKKYMPHFLNKQGERYFINACHSMWSSIYKSNLLKTKYEQANGFMYDVVIRCRFDEILVGPVDFFTYSMNSIHVSHCCDTPNYPYVRDWFAFSNSNNMNVYCDVINNFETINKRIPDSERMNERFLYEQLNGVVPVECHIFHSHFIRP
ncbi:MAG: hypothetical protein EBU90_16805 [Proteobacteria bacterium]|nr:hypothetical protein [Pseudomonadota bacterium]